MQTLAATFFNRRCKLAVYSYLLCLRPNRPIVSSLWTTMCSLFLRWSSRLLHRSLRVRPFDRVFSIDRHVFAICPSIVASSPSAAACLFVWSRLLHQLSSPTRRNIFVSRLSHRQAICCSSVVRSSQSLSCQPNLMWVDPSLRVAQAINPSRHPFQSHTPSYFCLSRVNFPSLSKLFWAASLYFGSFSPIFSKFDWVLVMPNKD